jgi:hypothetical protein
MPAGSSGNEESMQIDRARFLLLTASMAGGACASSPATPRSEDQPLKVAAPQMTVAADPAGAAIPPPREEPPITAEEATAAVGPTEGPAEEEEFTGRGNCDNSIGFPGDCSTIRPPPGPQCESFEDTKETCGRMRANFAPRVAEKAVACLLSSSGTRRICDFGKADACAVSAIRSACVDSRTAQICKPIVDQCARMRHGQALTMNECQAAISSVKAKARGSMISCISEGCSLDGCVYYLP